MSEEAKQALIDAPSSRQGTKILGLDHVVIAELLNAGVLGAGWGLTARGGIERDRLVTEALDAAF